MADETFVPQRYQAAWAEINARLQARQTVGVVYMTGAITLLGFAIDDQPSTSGQISWHLPFVLLLPILAFAVAKWLRHNDAIVGVLGAYCAAIEKIDWHPELPAWHSREHGFMNAALDYRLWSDHAAIIITTAASLPVALHLFGSVGLELGRRLPFFAWFPPPPGVERLGAVIVLFCVISTLAGCAAVKILLDNAPLRAQFLRGCSFRPDEHGRYGLWPMATSVDASASGSVRRFFQAFLIAPGTPSLPEGAQGSGTNTANSETSKTV